MLQETTMLSCPYCGESFDINVDCSAGDQSYIERLPGMLPTD